MTYNEVLIAIEEMVAGGSWNYIDYLNLVFQNWFSAAQWTFCYAGVWSIVIFGTIALVKYIKLIVNSIKEEVEG